MSGVVKGIRKVFKKVVDVVKKIALPALAIAAVYFTAGIALASYGPTSAFAAQMPGFAGASGAGGGIFSSVASKVGLGQGLAEGAGVALGAEGAVTANMLGNSALISEAVASAGGAGSGVLASGGSAVAGGFTNPVTGDVVTASGVKSAASKAAPDLYLAKDGVTAAKAGMSTTDKLLIASLGTQAVGTLMQDTEEDRTFQGSFYGTTQGGETSEMPRLYADNSQAPTGDPKSADPRLGMFSDENQQGTGDQLYQSGREGQRFGTAGKTMAGNENRYGAPELYKSPDVRAPTTSADPVDPMRNLV